MDVISYKGFSICNEFVGIGKPAQFRLRKLSASGNEGLELLGLYETVAEAKQAADEHRRIRELTDPELVYRHDFADDGTAFKLRALGEIQRRGIDANRLAAMREALAAGVDLVFSGLLSFDAPSVEVSACDEAGHAFMREQFGAGARSCRIPKSRAGDLLAFAQRKGLRAVAA